MVYADGSKHNYRYDGFTNSAQGNLKEQFGWIEADEMLLVLENFHYNHNKITKENAIQILKSC